MCIRFARLGIIFGTKSPRDLRVIRTTYLEPSYQRMLIILDHLSGNMSTCEEKSAKGEGSHAFDTNARSEIIRMNRKREIPLCRLYYIAIPISTVKTRNTFSIQSR